MFDVRLLAVVGPPVVDLSSLVASCQAAEAGGITAVQLRLHRVPALEILRLTEQLLKVLQVPIYVNDRADIALAAGAHGVHLGADDLDPVELRPLVPRQFRIGISVGSAEEAHTAATADVDYWSIGPVFPTSTKLDAGRAIGPIGFQTLAAKSHRSTPVIAIGGVTVENADEIFDAGAQGIAVSSGIFSETDIEAAARALRARIDTRTFV